MLKNKRKPKEKISKIFHIARKLYLYSFNKEGQVSVGDKWKCGNQEKKKYQLIHSS